MSASCLIQLCARCIHSGCRPEGSALARRSFRWHSIGTAAGPSAVGDVAEFFDAHPFAERVNNAVDVLEAELVLIAYLFKALTLTCVDEQNVVGVLSLLPQHQNAGRVPVP